MSYNTVDRHQASFFLLDINNNRTAWRPVGLPMIMVVPHAQTVDGLPIDNAQVKSLRVYIEDVAQNAYVVGQDHILADGTQLRYPARELYSQSISVSELTGYQINLNLVDFYDNNKNPIARAPIDGDFFKYTTATGIHGFIEYFRDAFYYDLSIIAIDIEILPSGYYNLIYEAISNPRVVTSYGSSDFLCINDNINISSSFRFGFDHPGHVLHEMYRHTPTPYLTNSKRSEDSTVAFYRPFSDILNDVYDEQNLLKSINWVKKTPVEMIPYLAYLLGWDLPYFPQTQGAKSLDSIRRAIIRNTTYFQNIKGSKKALKEIFKLFGLDIIVENLWWSPDGKELLRPNGTPTAPYADLKILAEEQPQLDIIFGGTVDALGTVQISGYDSSQSVNTIIDPQTNTPIGTFIQAETALLFEPKNLKIINYDEAITDSYEVTLEAVVIRDQDTKIAFENILKQAGSSPADYAQQKTLNIDTDYGFLSIKELDDFLLSANIYARSRVIFNDISGNIKARDNFGKQPAISQGSSYNRSSNTLNFSYAGTLYPGDYLYVWATYKRIVIDLPSEMADLGSNRFNIQILSKDLEAQIDPKTLNFSLDFLYKLKAFHSQLHVCRTSVNLHETYEVTDLKIGGDSPQRYENTDLGRLQVPPAILPNPLFTTCGTPEEVGFKKADINLRLKKLEDIAAEIENSSTFDDRIDDPFGGRIRPLPKQSTTSESGYVGSYAAYHQDVIIPDNRIESRSTISHPGPNANSQSTGSNFQDILGNSHESINGVVPGGRTYSNNRNDSSFGSFTIEKRATAQAIEYPIANYSDYAFKGRVEDEILYRSEINGIECYSFDRNYLTMGQGCYYTYPAITKMVVPNETFSGDAMAGGQPFARKEIPNSENDMLSRRLRAWITSGPETIHYMDQSYSSPQDSHEAIQKPGLNIQKLDMHIPGTRFPMMKNMVNDYISNTIVARPWDDQFWTGCVTEGSCSNPGNKLNATLQIDTNGDEVLAFDFAYFTSFGNSLEPDIIDLGVEQQFESKAVFHEIYTNQSPSSYAVLDQFEHTLEQVLAVASYAFSSGRDGYDIIDGYPSLANNFSFTDTGVYIYLDALNLLGFPATGSTVNLAYRLSSGIYDLNVATYRLDAGTLLMDGTTISQSPIASKSRFLDDGEYDFSPDRIRITQTMLFSETMNGSSLYLNGELKSMLETI